MQAEAPILSSKPSSLHLFIQSRTAMAAAVRAPAPPAELRSSSLGSLPYIPSECRTRCAAQALRRGGGALSTCRTGPRLVQEKMGFMGRNGAVREGRRWCGVPRASARAPARAQDDVILDDLAEAVLDVAEQVAQEAGLIIRRKLGRAHEVTSKEVRCDLVTEVDRECEALITKAVKATFPLHRIIGEETATEEALGSLAEGALGPYDWAWIIDPIDGTLNFVGGIPMCAVSVGVARGGAVEVAAVYDPFSNELFSARRGEGAYLNGKPLRAPGAPPPPDLELEDAAVAVGFPSMAPERAQLVKAMAAVAPHARTMRAFGSAALHMSYVAAGRLGCFFEPSLKPWDIAAARLLVEEAGGIVTDMEGTEVPLAGGSVVASRGGEALHTRVLGLIQGATGSETLHTRVLGLSQEATGGEEQ